MNSNTQKIPEVKQKPFVKWGEEDNGESVAIKVPAQTLMSLIKTPDTMTWVSSKRKDCPCGEE